MMPLAGQVAVVSGGSSGIGAATVQALAEAGARVAIGYASGHDRAVALAASLPGSGHVCLPMPMTDSAALGAAAATVEARFGRTDVLINSAATTQRIPLDDLEALNDATIDTILATNVRGPFATVRAFAPMLRASGQGVIVNISSTSATSGKGSNLIYCASKGALDTMTISLARALAPEVRVIGIAPGTVDTGFIPGITPEEIADIGRSAALRKVVTPRHVAQAVMAAVVHMPVSTGMRVVVDAGRHLG